MRTFVSTHRQRNRGLGTYSPEQRNTLLYAAGLTPGDIEAATREKIAKGAETAHTPNGIAAFLRAKQIVDDFFHKLNNPEDSDSV